MTSFKRFLVFLLFLSVPAASAWAGEIPRPGRIFDETIFEMSGGRIVAPRAKHLPEDLPAGPHEKRAGWSAAHDGDYIGFDADEVLSRESGTLEITVVLTDFAGLTALGRALESLVTLYDNSGTAFFTVGINDHDLTVGSFPVHPMIMEDAFGGLGFPYAAKLGAPPRDGTELTVTVTWGPSPSDDKVYVNGRFIEAAARKGSRNVGEPPGYEPKATFGSFLGGFKTKDGKSVGPPSTLTIGRMGVPDKTDRLTMYTPKSVAIRKLRLSNLIQVPSGVN